MCSILGVFDLRPADDLPELRRRALAASALQRHRGPDWSGVHASPAGILVHERLAIVDPAGGSQPLVDPWKERVLAVNGEIYNHREVTEALESARRASGQEPWPFQTGSDCEVLLPLLAHEGPSGLRRLNGIWAFALLEPRRGRWIVARDPVGVMPLYRGRDREGRLWVASEMKAISDLCSHLEVFPPGCVLDSESGALRVFRPRRWRPATSAAGPEGAKVRKGPEPLQAVEGRPGCTPLPSPPTGRTEGAVAVRRGLEAAVRRQLMSDVPWGVLLSGGLDSSVVAACAARFARRRVEDDGRTEAWWPSLHSFAIGLEESPDLEAAAQVAGHLGTTHHGFTFSIQEGLDAVPDVIRHIESFDVTTVRASVPMYLLARRIRAMGVKMVLSGEGADEVFGGYLYFHRAPSPEAFRRETERKVRDLHLFDCLRANKSMAAWGVEARVPFLDLEFLDLAMELEPALRMPSAGPGGAIIEKALLREAFVGTLPDELLWRQKEQFSDGVGYGWIDALREHATSRVDPAEMARAAERFPLSPPGTAEAFWYRSIFQEHFPGDQPAATVPSGPSIACSSPEALAWDPSFGTRADPSGRSVSGVHRASLEPGEAAPPGISRLRGR
ncbi:MAG: asparagine synthase B [Gemmatimonadales bacterium]|nr:MAG: asparagine synthase B [Gemmatimonadales bacterium]